LQNFTVTIINNIKINNQLKLIIAIFLIWHLATFVKNLSLSTNTLCTKIDAKTMPVGIAAKVSFKII
jgi:hypothetical protein